jgi:predicted ATPase/DNA-binding winged helix-turn-helix (wHTH) protein
MEGRRNLSGAPGPISLEVRTLKLLPAYAEAKRMWMTDDAPYHAPEVISFGPFRLNPAQRLLEKSGTQLHLGARALEILIVLAERAGEVVSKKTLLARVWPDVIVDKGTLRFHIAALRRALGDGQQGARYVTTFTGRGYCFVAPVTRSNAPTQSNPEALLSDQSHKLPTPLTRMVGRDEAIRNLSTQLVAERFVTIVGPGGIGKTTVAISIANNSLSAYDGAVHFLDLGPLNDPLLVASAVASTFGLVVQSSDPTPSLINFLRFKRVLLLLDSCEHVIETAAALAERIFEEAPHVHILATSREPLRVEGEHVYQLAPLDSPPDTVGITAAQALTFPAAQLFVERVAASGYQFELSDIDAPIVGKICRKLDGIALAIELAASRVSAHGIQQTATLLDSRFRLLWHGRRTALLRHQTLSATLDWSYDLLPELERTILRRLSIFVGFFTLEAAQFVAAGDDIDAQQLVTAVSSLVSKSLTSADISSVTTRYRLLDTTRCYALEKLDGSGDAEAIARRHAIYFTRFLQSTDPDASLTINADGLASYGQYLGNIRAALEWCFFDRRDLQTGALLAAAAAPIFLKMSLWSECHRWSERAITALDDTTRGTRREMELQSALGLSLMFTKGNSEQAHVALARGLQLAEELGDRSNQLRLLGRLHIFHERIGDFHGALQIAERSEAIAGEIADPTGISAAHSLLGISYHLMGNQTGARKHLNAALVPPTVLRGIDTFHFGFDHRNRAGIALARTLWAQGYSDQALRIARQTVEEAATFNHPVTLCISLIWAVSVYLWIGDWISAEENVERFISHADKYSLAPYQAVGLGIKGVLLIKRGEVEAGIHLLRVALESVHAHRYELLTTEFNITLAEGLGLTGRVEEALETIDRTIVLVESNGDLFNMPELLRVKGDILASAPRPRSVQAADCFEQALKLAGQQSAPAWELRAATSLAIFLSEQGHCDQARDALSRVYHRFTEGFETADLIAAKHMLEELG